MTKGEVSKATAGRALVSRAILSSLQVHGPEVQQKLESLLFPKGMPKQVTVGVILGAVGNVLESAVEEMTQADIAHSAELGDDDSVRRERDDAVACLREHVMDVRSSLQSAHGVEVLRPYGLDGETPINPEVLLQLARKSAEAMQTRPLKEPAKRKGLKVDIKALGEEISHAAGRLDAALKAVNREEREAQLTLNRRNEAAERWNQHYQGIADLVTGLYELIGRYDLADRVRPTSKRRVGLPEEADTEEGSPAAGENPTPS